MNQNIYKERNSVVPVASEMSTGISALTFHKNWRLVQLMAALESGFSPIRGVTYNAGNSVSNSENKQVRSYLKNGRSPFLFARPYKALCKINLPEVKYKNIYITNPIASQVLYSACNPVVIKACSPQRDLSVGSQSGERDIGMLTNFPIKANFVAQWLSENIVSSKTYKLSLLCDRVIKASFLLVGKSQFTLSSTGLNEIQTTCSTLGSKQKVSTPQRGVSEFILVGIKIIISGRILGAEIATSKTFKAGQIPNNTITILKDRGFALAKTRSGTIGVKVIYFWSPQKGV